MISLIDGDIVCYRVGWTTEQETDAIAAARCHELIFNILTETNAQGYNVYLSDSKENNFRYQVDPQYKANRTAPKPKHLEFLKELLITEHRAKIAYGMEADDYLGIHQTNDSIICSIDKDLMQIPGSHYNFVNKSFTTVTKEQGLLHFYRSILTGDTVDNIKGVFKIGPKKAEKILPEWINEEEAIIKLRDTYQEWITRDELPDHPDDLILKNGRLLKIKQHKDEELWNSIYLKPTGEKMLVSIQPQPEESNPFTEPIIPGLGPSDGFPAHGQ